MPAWGNSISCYFVIDTYIDKDHGRGEYEKYVDKVKPIVKKYGGIHLCRTEKVTYLNPAPLSETGHHHRVSGP